MHSKSGLGRWSGRIFAGAALALPLVFSACGGGSITEPRDRFEDLNTAEEVLSAALGALNSVSSYRSERQSAATSQADGREIGSAIWSLIWSAPDAINLSIQAVDEGEERDFRLVAAEDRVFAKQSTTGDVWKEYEPQSGQEGPEVRGILSMIATFSPTPDFVPEMDEADLVGKEFIDGLGVCHVMGTKSVKQKIWATYVLM